jgi:hypothetical protein
MDPREGKQLDLVNGQFPNPVKHTDASRPVLVVKGRRGDHRKVEGETAVVPMRFEIGSCRFVGSQDGEFSRCANTELPCVEGDGEFRRSVDTELPSVVVVVDTVRVSLVDVDTVGAS